MDGKQLPFLSTPHDTFREGFRSLQHDVMDKHPVETMQKMHFQTEEQTKMKMYGSLYGTHLPLRLNMERSILAQFGRLPGLPSSHVGLDTMLGRDEEIVFEDYLNDSALTQDQKPLHDIMESKLGM
eukprot:GILK01002154.1.p1 GENE.GILK01002154.1~~GILK01002154.1.p1  ORF type:complete len:126 (+),score=14.27 GILK01002154.1:228-605(+)